MIHDHQLAVNQGLLKYILFHYMIDNKESVWVLNYLKDQHVLKHFIISRPTEDLTEGLTVTSTFRLLFQYKDRIITEADVIFNLLERLDETYYLYFAFDNERIQRDERRSMVNYRLEMKQPVVDLVDEQLKQEVRHNAEIMIDLAIVMNDKKSFNYYSGIIKQLKE